MPALTPPALLPKTDGLLARAASGGGVLLRLRLLGVGDTLEDRWTPSLLSISAVTASKLTVFRVSCFCCCRSAGNGLLDADPDAAVCPAPASLGGIRGDSTPRLVRFIVSLDDFNPPPDPLAPAPAPTPVADAANAADADANSDGDTGADGDSEADADGAGAAGLFDDACKSAQSSSIAECPAEILGDRLLLLVLLPADPVDLSESDDPCFDEMKVSLLPVLIGLM